MDDYGIKAVVKRKCITLTFGLEELENSCITMVTVDGRPFSAVEDVGTQILLKPLIKALGLSSNYAMNRHKIRELVQAKALHMRKSVARGGKGAIAPP